MNDMIDILQYLDTEVDKMIASAIRIKDKDPKRQFNYSLRVGDMLKATGRQRLNQFMINYALEYFKVLRTEARYYEGTRHFNVSFNLYHVTLNQTQVALLAEQWGQICPA